MGLENANASNSKIVLGLDLDGVLYDWHGALYTHFQYEMGYSGSYQQFWRDFVSNWTEDTWNFWTSVPMICEMRSPSEPVISFLDFASKHSKEILYVTSRPLSVEAVTRKYLEKFNFPFSENLYMSADKPNVCRLYGVTHFLDDHANHVKNVSAVCNSYLLAKIWNEKFQDTLPTVYSLDEFRKVVFE